MHALWCSMQVDCHWQAGTELTVTNRSGLFTPQQLTTPPPPANTHTHTNTLSTHTSISFPQQWHIHRDWRFQPINSFWLLMQGIRKKKKKKSSNNNKKKKKARTAEILCTVIFHPDWIWGRRKVSGRHNQVRQYTEHLQGSRLDFYIYTLE